MPARKSSPRPTSRGSVPLHRRFGEDFDAAVPLDASVVLNRLRESRSREDALVYALALSALDSCEAVHIYFEGFDTFWWHEGHARPFGYSSPGEFVTFSGDWWFEKIHPDDQKMMSRIAGEFLTEGKRKTKHSSQFRWRRADGVYRDVACNTTSVFATTGDRIASVTTYRDLTEEISARMAMEAELAYRKQTEKALRRESKLRTSAERIVRKQAEASARTIKLLLRNPGTQDIMHGMLRTIALECGAVWSTLWRIDESTREVSRAGIFHRDELLERRVERFVHQHASALATLGGTYLELAEMHRCTFILAATDQRVSPEIQRFYKNIGVEVALVVPLVLGRRLLGWLSLLLPQRADGIHPDVVAFIEMAGNQAVLAIYLKELGDAARETEQARENERLAREREQEASWVSRLLRVQDAGPSPGRTGVDDLLKGVLKNISELLAGEAAQLWKFDEVRSLLIPAWETARRAGNAPTPTHFNGPAPDWIATHRECLMGWSRELDIRIERAAESRLWRGFADDLDPAGMPVETRLVSIPLRLEEELYGFVLVVTATNFPAASERWLAVKALGIQAALALRLDALSKLQRTAVLAQERNRIARDMHDMLAQGFSGISLQIEAMRLECPEMPPQIEARLEKIRAQAGRSVEEVRRSIQMLRPVLLDALRLPAALAALAQEVQATSGMRITAEVPEKPLPLGSRMEIHLFAIATEAVQNAVRHSEGKAISLSLKKSRGRVVLAIQDDGHGLKTGPRPRAGHFGLLNMQERAAAIDGTITFKKIRGKGLRVEISVRD